MTDWQPLFGIVLSGVQKYKQNLIDILPLAMGLYKKELSEKPKIC